MEFRGIPEEKLRPIRHLVPLVVKEIRVLQAPGTQIPTIVRAMTAKEIGEGRRVRGPGHEGGAGHGVYDGETIGVNTSMEPDLILANIIHEMLHAVLPATHEVEIDRTTDEIMKRVYTQSEDMTPVERSSLRLAIHRGSPGAAQRIQKQVMRRETAQFKPKAAQIRSFMAQHRASQATAREKERAAAEKLLKQKQAKQTVAADLALDRLPLLLDAVVSGAIATPPSPHVRPDLTGKRISGAPSIGMDTGKVGLRSKGGFAVYPGAVRKEKQRGFQPSISLLHRVMRPTGWR